MTLRAVFLDRDGVINHDADILYRKEQIVLYPNVKEALKELKNLDYLLIVINNQPAIARGLATEKDAKELNKFINSKLDNLIDDFYFCPHHPNASVEKYRKICDCRKPAPGLLLKAAEDFDIDLKKSWMIGDMPSDIQAGKLAGYKTILIKSENNYKIIKSGIKIDSNIQPDARADNLAEAANLIADYK